MNPLAISSHVLYHITERGKDQKCFSSREGKALWGQMPRSALKYIRPFITCPWDFLSVQLPLSSLSPKTLATPKDLEFSNPTVLWVALVP